MSSKRTEAASATEWESHKITMQKLFVGDNKSLDEVMWHMKTEYSFVASKTQYEKKFKGWGVRKNISTDEWAYVLNKKHEREVHNKPSEVTLFDKVVTAEKIKKAESRFSIGQLHSIYHTSLKRKTPPGILVYTPPQESPHHIVEEPSAPQATPDIAVPLHIQVREPVSYPNTTKKRRSTANLISGNVRIEEFSNIATSREFPPPVKRELPYIEFLNSCDSLNLNEKFSRLVREESVGFNTLNLPSPRLLAADANTLFECNSIGLQESPENMLENPPFSESTYLTPSLSTLFLSGTLSGRDVDSLDELRDREQHLHERLLDMPERTDGEKVKSLQILLGPPQSESLSFLLTTAVYLNSNGTKWGYPAPIMSPIMLWIARNIPFESMKMLFQAKVPTVEAFKYELLQAGLFAGNFSLTKNLLDMDRRLKRFLLGSKKLLEFTINADKIEVVDLLVQLIGDVRRFETEHSFYLLSYCNSVPVAQLLVAAGAHVQPHALRNAVYLHNTEMIKFLICAGTYLNTADGPYDGQIKGVEALMVAVYKHDVELLKLLLEKNVNVNQVSKRLHGLFSGRTALQVAATKAHIEIVEILLNNGADVNAPAYGDVGHTALQAAVENADIGTVELLLNRGAIVDAPGTTSKYPRTALLAAAEKKSNTLIEMLLKFKANPNSPSFGYYGTTVLEAARGLQLDRPTILSLEAAASNLKHQPLCTDKHLKSRYMRVQLLHAIRKADLTRIKQLVAAGVEIDLKPVNDTNSTYVQHAHRRRSTIFHSAIMFPKIWSSEIFKFLFQYTNSSTLQLLDSDLEPLLHTAIYWRRFEITEFLLDIVGVDINYIDVIKSTLEPSEYDRFDFRVTGIFHAVEQGNLEMVQLLRCRGAGINPLSQDQPDLLQVSLDRFHYHIARYLLDCGMDSNNPATRYNEATTLCLAIKGCSREFLEYIVAKGARVDNRPDTNKQTALQVAVDYGRLDLVQVLLDYNADANAAPPKNGRTALQLTAAKGYLRIAQLLLDRGADVNMVGQYFSTTALEEAALRCQLDMVQLLINAGADKHLPLNKRFLRPLRLAKECKYSPNLGVIAVLECYRKEAIEQLNSLRILEMVGSESDDEDESDYGDEAESSIADEE